MPKKIYCQDNFRKKIFLKALAGNKKLIKVIFQHWFQQLKHYFGILNYIKMNQVYWDYLDQVNVQNLISENPELIKKMKNDLASVTNGDIVLLPQAIIDKIDLGAEVIALESIDSKEFWKSKELKSMILINGLSTSLATRVKDSQLGDEKTKNERIKKTIWMFGCLFLLSIIPTIIAFLYSASVDNRWLLMRMLDSPQLLWVNFLPIFLVMTFVYFASKRLWVSFFITSSVTFILALSNYFKQNLRHEPLYFSDLFTVREGLSAATAYKIEFTDKMWLILFGILIITIILKFIPMVIEFRKTTRWAIVLLSLGILVGPIVQGYGTEWMYEYTRTLDSSRFNKLHDYTSRGFVYSFIRSYSEFIGIAPKGYDQNRVDELLAKYQEKDLVEEQQVNILMIMLESYVDLTKYTDLSEGDIDPYYYFHQLQEDSYHGEMIVDVYGGGTIQTERTVLTGYNQQGQFIRETESFPWYFARNGYIAESFHPYVGWFYGRNKVNHRLGFESYFNFDNAYPVEQGSGFGYPYSGEEYMTDENFLESVMKRFEETIDQGRYTFDFATTFQGHGSYPTESITEFHYLPEDENMNNELYNGVNGYLHWVTQTDIALQNLREDVDQLEEPVVLVIFGDHLPALGVESVTEYYESLGINFNTETIEGVLNKHTTQYLFYMNEAAKEKFNVDPTIEGNLISANYLMPELFEYLGLEGPIYMQYLIDLKQKMPIQSLHLVEFNGEMFHRGEVLSDEIEEILSEYNDLSYYMQYKYNPR